MTKEEKQLATRIYFLSATAAEMAKKSIINDKFEPVLMQWFKSMKYNETISNGELSIMMDLADLSIKNTNNQIQEEE